MNSPSTEISRIGRRWCGFQSRENLEAYNRVLAKRAELLATVGCLAVTGAGLVQHWLGSKQNPAQPVSTDKLLLRLRLDEGGGEVLKNSAPEANPKSFPIGKYKPQWGETTWLWPDFRMDTSTRVVLGQIGDFEWNQPFSSGGWFMLRSAPNFTSSKLSGALVSKMDSTQHDRGWDLAAENGIISVELADQAPKEQPLQTSRKRAPKKAERKDRGQEIEAPEVGDDRRT